MHVMPVKVRELLSMLDEAGRVQVRQEGSHRPRRHPLQPGTVTVSGQPSVDVPAGTLNGILKQAGLKSKA
jgi:predicted RNA binding protein YcfA (HicA-like mRNA interferase family)